MKTIFNKRCLVVFVVIVAVSQWSAVSNKPINEETMSVAAFRTYTGMKAFFSQDFDFNFKCDIKSFELIFTAPRQDALVLRNEGWAFGAKVLQAVKAASPGAVYVFQEIRARCPGDSANRKLSAIVVTVR